MKHYKVMKFFLSWVFFLSPFLTVVVTRQCAQCKMSLTILPGVKLVTQEQSTAAVVPISKSLHDLFASPHVVPPHPFTLPHLSPLYPISSSFSFPLQFQNVSLLAAFGAQSFSDRNNQPGKEKKSSIFSKNSVSLSSRSVFPSSLLHQSCSVPGHGSPGSRDCLSWQSDGGCQLLICQINSMDKHYIMSMRRKDVAAIGQAGD